MVTTPHLGMTLVEQSQAQKEITVNQALMRIDAVLNTGAISRSASAPPATPAQGDLYIVGAAPTGAWAGQAGMVAYWDQLWRFIAPRAGMSLWVIDESLICTYNGTGWAASVLGESNTASNLGAGAGLFGSKSGVDLRFKSLVAGTNVSLSSTASDITISASGTGGGGYATVQEEGTALAQRGTVNFIGGGITAADNAASGRTDVTLDATLNALAAFNSNGIMAQTAADTFAARAIAAPAAGITISNGDGVSGNPTLALANDLGALEGLGGTGFAVRTAADSWAVRSLSAGSGIAVSNGDGVGANPSISLSASLSLLSGTLQASQFPALTGDVTTSAGSLAASIGAGKVTNAMLAGGIDLAAKVTGLLPLANGGTGQATANAALNALLPAQSGNSGKYLSTDGSNSSWAAGSGGGIADPGSNGMLVRTALNTVSAASLSANAVLTGNGTGTPNATGVTVDAASAIYGYFAKTNPQSGTSYTLASGDSGKIVECGNAAAITVTLPNSLAAGFSCTVVQAGAGQVTFSAASGATLRSFDSYSKTAGQWAAVSLYVTANAGGAAAVYVMQGRGA